MLNNSRCLFIIDDITGTNNELFREAIKDYTEESNPLLVVFTFK